MLNHRALNLLLLGEESAATLGVDVRRTHKLLVLLASLMAGTTIAVSGTIGFVGLMVPHFTRLLVGSDHKKVLPVAALLGGVLVVWTDVAARMVIAPEELPVGILTAVAGGPVFIWMLRRRGGGDEARRGARPLLLLRARAGGRGRFALRGARRVRRNHRAERQRQVASRRC